MPIAFFIGVRWGPIGMAWAWLAAFPLVTLYTAAIAMPIIGVGARTLARAIGPGLIASAGMTALVFAIDRSLTFDSPLVRLATLVGAGVAAYAVLVPLVARSAIRDVIWLAWRRTAT
jgi:hypothetical protein